MARLTNANRNEYTNSVRKMIPQITALITKGGFNLKNDLIELISTEIPRERINTLEKNLSFYNKAEILYIEGTLFQFVIRQYIFCPPID